MNELMLLAENFKVSVLAGVNLGWQGIGGIILFLTGIGLIYFGIKALKGYRFFPDQEQNIPEEDHYEPMQAKALQKVKQQCRLLAAVKIRSLLNGNRLYCERRKVYPDSYRQRL